MPLTGLHMVDPDPVAHVSRHVCKHFGPYLSPAHPERYKAYAMRHLQPVTTPWKTYIVMQCHHTLQKKHVGLKALRILRMCNKKEVKKKEYMKEQIYINK